MTPKSSYHKLLQRQIKKVQALNVSEDEKWDMLFDLVHESYTTHDRDINHLKNVIRESSAELLESNENLKKAHAEIADAYTNEVGLSGSNRISGPMNRLNSSGEISPNPLNRVISGLAPNFLMAFTRSSSL